MMGHSWRRTIFCIILILSVHVFDVISQNIAATFSFNDGGANSPSLKADPIATGADSFNILQRAPKPNENQPEGLALVDFSLLKQNLLLSLPNVPNEPSSQIPHLSQKIYLPPFEACVTQGLSPPSSQPLTQSHGPTFGVVRPLTVHQSKNKVETCDGLTMTSQNINNAINITATSTISSSPMSAVGLSQKVQQPLIPLVPYRPSTAEMKPIINTSHKSLELTLPVNNIPITLQKQPAATSETTTTSLTEQIASEVDLPEKVLRERASAVVPSYVSKPEDIKVSNEVNSEVQNIAQSIIKESPTTIIESPSLLSNADVCENSAPTSPINLVINIPPVNVPVPSIILLPSPSLAPQPVAAPSVPQFGFPHPIVIEGSRSRQKNNNWLPILLIALLGDGFGGEDCGCCNSCCFAPIPIPYPIPVPFSDDFYVSGPTRRRRKGSINSYQSRSNCIC